MRAYLLFTIAADKPSAATELGHKSLANAKQIVIGGHLGDVFLHVESSEQDRAHPAAHLTRAMADLSAIDGVTAMSVISIRA